MLGDAETSSDVYGEDPGHSFVALATPDATRCRSIRMAGMLPGAPVGDPARGGSAAAAGVGPAGAAGGTTGVSEIPFQLKVLQIENPEALNLILGQSHFIKTVEDIHEAVVTEIPGARFGLAFCESSGAALVRSTGTDAGLKALAERNALALGAGHSFILFLRDAFPINVLNAIKMVPEVANIYCATANPCR